MRNETRYFYIYSTVQYNPDKCHVHLPDDPFVAVSHIESLQQKGKIVATCTYKGELLNLYDFYIKVRQ